MAGCEQRTLSNPEAEVADAVAPECDPLTDPGRRPSNPGLFSKLDEVGDATGLPPSAAASRWEA